MVSFSSSDYSAPTVRRVILEYRTILYVRNTAPHTYLRVHTTYSYCTTLSEVGTYFPTLYLVRYVGTRTLHTIKRQMAVYSPISFGNNWFATKFVIQTIQTTQKILHIVVFGNNTYWRIYMIMFSTMSITITKLSHTRYCDCMYI